MKIESRKNIIWIEAIKTISIYMVVMIHVCAPILLDSSLFFSKSWWIAHLLDSISRICVPLFFMINGYLMLQKDESITTTVIKRIFPLVNILLFWSIFYIFIKIVFNNYEYSLRSVIVDLLTNGASFHLWFLYELIGLYMFLPICRVLVRNSRDIILWYFICVWFFYVGISPYLKLLTGIELALNLKMFGGYLGYYIAGYLLGETTCYANNKMLNSVSILIYLVCLSFTVYFTYSVTLQSNKLALIFYDYLSFNVVLMSFSSFLLLKKIFENFETQPEWTIIGKNTLGIYLIHLLILSFLKKSIPFFAHIHLNLFLEFTKYLLFSLSTLLASFILINISKKIPILNRLT